jgi:flagellar basal-body rod protein FlgG
MNRGIYPILSGALVQEQRLHVTANNLANVNTTGFKRDEPLFRSVMSRVAPSFPLSAQTDAVVQPVFNTGRRASERIFAAPQSLDTIFETGRLRATGNPYDMAIQGPGFFEVKTPQGTRYTRNGVFHLDAKRRLVNESNLPVMGTVGGKKKPVELKVPEGNLTISPNGAMHVNGDEFGTVRVVEFGDRDKPVKAGDGFYTGRNPKPAKDTQLLQGHIEESAVNTITEMVKMIQVMRAYETASKMIQTLDRTAETAIQDLGRVA